MRGSDQPERIAHCWADSREENPNAVPGTCLLVDQHLGPHDYTPDSEIVMYFKDLGDR